MRLSLAKLKTRLPVWWNKRPATEQDFYNICRRERITVREIPLRVPGYYMIFMNRRFIIINSRLRGIRWLHVAIHELGHHFLHLPKCQPNGSLFFLDNNSKEHAEAEAFAMVTMIPDPLLRSLLKSGEYFDVDDEGLSAELFKERRALYERYGFFDNQDI
jgi:Zn-dependent peptidase ImmA (M78 family)